MLSQNVHLVLCNPIVCAQKAATMQKKYTLTMHAGCIPVFPLPTQYIIIRSLGKRLAEFP